MKKILLTLFCVLFLFACATPQIPQEAVSLNQHVSQGITALQQNALDVIQAWEDAAKDAVGNQWDAIYEEAETKYRKVRNIQGELSPENYAEIAALASIIRDKLDDKVEEKADEMRATVTNNGGTVLTMNQRVTDLLASNRRVIEANEELLKTVSDIVPIPENLLGVGGN